MANVLRPPSAAHPFGTDEFGRDLLSRVLYGGRVTLLASTLSVLLAAMIGCTVGLTAGYFGGWYDALVGRIVDILFAFPVILLGIAIVAIMGPGVVSVDRRHRRRVAPELRAGLAGGDRPGEGARVRAGGARGRRVDVVHHLRGRCFRT